jgi:hypothetical protein
LSGAAGVPRFHSLPAGALLAMLLAQPAPAETPAAAPAPAAPPAPNDEILENKVVAVLGLAAKAEDGKDVGRIVDVLVDQAGRPRAAVIDVGGFLGVGNRKVAVDWEALRFDMGKATATLGLAADRIKGAPAYDPGKPVEALVVPPPAPAQVGPPPQTPSALAPVAAPTTAPTAAPTAAPTDPGAPAPASVPAQ